MRRTGMHVGGVWRTGRICAALLAYLRAGYSHLIQYAGVQMPAQGAVHAACMVHACIMQAPGRVTLHGPADAKLMALHAGHSPRGASHNAPEVCSQATVDAGKSRLDGAGPLGRGKAKRSHLAHWCLPGAYLDP